MITLKRKLSALVRAMRIPEQTIIVVPYLFGILDSGQISRRTLAKYVLALISLVLISIATFLINEYADANDTDKFRTDKKVYIGKGGLSPQGALVTTAVFSVGGLVVSIPAGAFWPVLATSLVGIAYSLPPIRTKARPYWDIFSMILFFGVLPYSVSSVISGRPPNFFNLTFLALMGATCDLLAAARDMQADKKAGLRTIATALNYKKTFIAGALTAILAATLGAVMIHQHQSWWYYPMILLALIFLSICSFGDGSRYQPERINHYFVKAARFGTHIFYSFVLYQLVLIYLIYLN